MVAVISLFMSSFVPDYSGWNQEAGGILRVGSLLLCTMKGVARLIFAYLLGMEGLLSLA